MKKTISTILFILLVSSPVLHAAPERMVLKDSKKAAKEKISRAAIRNINLEDIEDPAAKRAIGEILNYLNLQSQK